MRLLFSIVKLISKIILIVIFSGVLLSVVFASALFFARQAGYQVVPYFTSQGWHYILMAAAIVFSFFSLSLTVGGIIRWQQRRFPGRYQKIVREVSGCDLTAFGFRTRIGKGRFVQPYCYHGAEHDRIGAVIIDDVTRNHIHYPLPVELEPTLGDTDGERSIQTALLESNRLLVAFSSSIVHHTYYILSCDLDSGGWSVFYPKHFVDGKIENVYERGVRKKGINACNDRGEDLSDEEWVRSGKHCRDGNLQLLPEPLTVSHEHDIPGILADEITIRQIPAGIYIESRYEQRCPENEKNCEEIERFCYTFNPPLHGKFR